MRRHGRLLARGLAQVVLFIAFAVVVYGLLTSDAITELGILRLTP